MEFPGVQDRAYFPIEFPVLILKTTTSGHVQEIVKESGHIQEV